MDLRQLELFLAVIDQSSVSKAAASMSITTSAVSQQLHNLAAGMRTELFVKRSKRLIPTPSALRLAEHARSVLRHVDRIEREFKGETRTGPETIHMACGATTLLYNLGHPLRLLRKQFPHIVIRITVLSTEEMVAGVFDRRFDMALISLPFPIGNLGVIPLYDEEMLILRPSTKRMRSWRVSAIQPSELAQAPFLLYPKRSNLRSIVDRFFLEIGIQPKVAMEVDETGVIKGLVESGFGYSVLPEFALHSGARFFRAFRVPGKRVRRVQALVYVKTEIPQPVTMSIASVLQRALARNRADAAERNQTGFEG
jgi:DNA-binding transcriptional LysR family regulator